MLCVPPPACALSTTVRLALNVPATAGVNFTATVQLAPAASELPQLLVCAKYAAFAPVMLIPVKLNAVPPGLLSVTFIELLVACFTVPKLRLDGLKLATGLITCALNATGCGLPGALLIICRVAVCGV